jgi:glycosyltransferase involved in cell wall biosynthesis
MVSVIIPAYNCANYIAETLDSVFAQSFRDYEVIVVNDGSPDTAELKRILAPYESRIFYFEQENRGPSAAKNAGIRHARGEFLAFLDSDDLWEPGFLSEQLRFFELDPPTDMVCADCVFFGGGEMAGKRWQSLDPISPPVTFEKILPTHGGGFGSFALLRSSMVAKVGFFDEELRICEDYQYWLRLLHLGGKLSYSSKVLGKRRLHASSLTHDPSIVLPHAVRALEKLLAGIDGASREAELVRREISRSRSRVALREGRRQLDRGDFAAARQNFAAANSATPSLKLKMTVLGLQWFPSLTRRAIQSRDNRK